MGHTHELKTILNVQNTRLRASSGIAYEYAHRIFFPDFFSQPNLFRENRSVEKKTKKQQEEQQNNIVNNLFVRLEDTELNAIKKLRLDLSISQLHALLLNCIRSFLFYHFNNLLKCSRQTM